MSSMLKDCNKMAQLSFDKLNEYKFKIGERVRNDDGKIGIVEAMRVKYCRRYYDIKFDGCKNLKTMIETDLRKC